jgi:hypothetical protein
METIDLGKYKVATSWDEVTLKQWSEYIKLTSEQKNKEVDIITTLETFSDIPREVIHQIPTDLFESIINRMRFLMEEPKLEPTNKLEYKGETYYVNIMEKLKVKEYLDLNTVLENDKYNYPVIFAILLRKENEEYNEEYIATTFDKRLEMMNQIPVTKALPIIGFFLNLWNEYEQSSLNYLMANNLKSELIKLVKSIKSSLSPMDYIIPSRVQRIMTLRKLEKSLKNI